MLSNIKQSVYNFIGYGKKDEKSFKKELEVPPFVVDIIRYYIKIEDSKKSGKIQYFEDFPRHFDVNRLRNHSNSILIIGKANSGKTKLAMDLIHNINNNTSIVFNRTEENMAQYSLEQDHMIYKEYDDNILKNLVNSQNEALRKQMKNTRSRGKRKDIRKTLVLDDGIIDENREPSRQISNVVMNSRHYYLDTIITSQTGHFPPRFRANINYIFIGRENYLCKQDRLYKLYGGMFSTKSAFMGALDKYTKNYGFMVIDNKSRSNNVRDNVFWYKAER